MNLKDTISFNTISPVFGVYLHMLVALFYLLGIHNIFASHKYIHQTCIRREIPPQTYVLVCSGLFDLSFLWRQCDYIYNVVIVTVFQFRFQGLCEWILRRMTYPSFMYPGRAACYCFDQKLLNSRVRRKGRMVTIPFARGKHMQFAVVLVIYDII